MSKGVFVWFDYMAHDVDKAIAFYGETNGWKAQPWGSEGYQLFMLAEEEAVGGVMPMPEGPAAAGAPAHWMAYISCEDADACAARCSELGGQVLREPWDIPNVGRSAILKDPQGAVFGIVAPDNEMAPADPAIPGAFSWAELMTTDWEAGLQFYQGLFGWQPDQQMDMGEDGTYQTVETEGAMNCGMMNIPEGGPPHWLYYMTTTDLDEATSRIERLGGRRVVGPVEVPGGRVSAFDDSQGGRFALHETTAS